MYLLDSLQVILSNQRPQFDQKKEQTSSMMKTSPLLMFEEKKIRMFSYYRNYPISILVSSGWVYSQKGRFDW